MSEPASISAAPPVPSRRAYNVSTLRDNSACAVLSIRCVYSGIATAQSTASAPDAHVVQREPAAMSPLVTTLHKNLHAGFPGRVAVSLLGVAMTLLLLSGIILHPRRRAHATRLRLKNGWRVMAADAHRLAGLCALDRHLHAHIQPAPSSRISP